MTSENNGNDINSTESQRNKGGGDYCRRVFLQNLGRSLGLTWGQAMAESHGSQAEGQRDCWGSCGGPTFPG